MAEDAANNINPVFALAEVHRHFLGGIRHWSNLKMASEEGVIWIKDFRPEQIVALELKSIPFGTLFTERNGWLFRQGALVPERRMPQLLWTPIARALPLQRPATNPNFFGIEHTVTFRLITASQERQPSVLMVTLPELGACLSTASSVRLRNLSWVLAGADSALVFGLPFLPVRGAAFWRKGDFLLPAGYDVQFSIVEETLQDVLSGNGTRWILWNADTTYTMINKDTTVPLTLGSFRRSTEAATPI